MPRILSLYFTSFAHLNFQFFKNSIIGFYIFTYFGYLDSSFFLLSFLLRKKGTFSWCVYSKEVNVHYFVFV